MWRSNNRTSKGTRMARLLARVAHINIDRAAKNVAPIVVVVIVQHTDAIDDAAE